MFSWILSIMLQINDFSNTIISVIIGLIKMISMPLIFFSILSAFASQDIVGTKRIIKKIILYTFFTTIISSAIGILSYILFFSSNIVWNFSFHMQNFVSESTGGYFLNIIPKDVLSPFINQNPLSVAILSFIFGIGTMSLRDEYKTSIHKFSKTCVGLLLEIFRKIMKILGPVLFVLLFIVAINELRSTQESSFEVLKYMICIVLSNLFHGLIFIPLFLKYKGISAVNLFKNIKSVLAFAFFSKSSSASLPLAIDVAQNKLKYDSKIASTSLPMCIIVNMNACAAFISTCVLFVYGFTGHAIDIYFILNVLFVSVIAAIGNSGVPMGCFFMATSYLSAIGIDTSIMILILPFYLLLDMIESAANVWSDFSVTSIVDKEMKHL
jgi:Na+/H+-dicarboxylate symporter